MSEISFGRIFENCGLFKDMWAGETFENFLKDIGKYGHNVEMLRNFFSSCKNLGAWDVKMIVDRPKILESCCFIQIENFIDLVITYGVYCDLAGVRPPYFSEDGTPILGGIVEETIETRRHESKNILECASKGATVSVLVHLDSIMREYLAQGTADSHMETSTLTPDKLRAAFLRETMTKTFTIASENGNMELLTCLYRHGCPFDASAMPGAASGGHLKAVKFLESINCPSNHLENMIGACKSGNLELVKYILSRDWGLVSKEKNLYAAESAGHLAFVDFLESKGCKIESSAMISATRGGNVNIVKYLYEHGCDMIGAEAMVGHRPARYWMARAAEHGKLEDLECLYEIYGRRVLDALVFRNAAARGHVEILKFLLSKSCPCDASAVQAAVMNNQSEAVLVLLRGGCPCEAGAVIAAINMSNILILKCLFEYRCPKPKDSKMIEAAICVGDLTILRFLCENGTVPDIFSYYTALYEGQFSDARRREIVDFLIRTGCPLTEHAFRSAVSSGRLEYVKWFYELGCPQDTDSCSLAVKFRKLEIVKYMVETVNISLTADLVTAAVDADSLETVKYLCELGCPVDISECLRIAYRDRYNDIIEYLEENYQTVLEY